MSHNTNKTTTLPNGMRIESAIVTEILPVLQEKKRHGVARQCGFCGEIGNPDDPKLKFKKIGEDWACRPCQSGIFGL